MTNNEGIPELAFDAVNVSDPGAIPYTNFPPITLEKFYL